MRSKKLMRLPSAISQLFRTARGIAIGHRPSDPSLKGDISTLAASHRPLLITDDSRRLPPSAINDMNPRRYNRSITAFRSCESTSLICSTWHGRSGRKRSVKQITLPGEYTFADGSVSPRASSTILAGFFPATPLTVSEGSSAITVPAATMMASYRARRLCMRVDVRPVENLTGPEAAAVKPSVLMAHFSNVYGRRNLWAVKNFTLRASHSSRSTPTVTSIPA